MSVSGVVMWLMVGAIAAVGLVGLGRRLGERRTFGLGLIVAAAVYAAFALAPPGPWLAVEAAGVALFTGLAVAGMRGAPAWLALGWGAHALWDGGLHLSGLAGGVAPAWYAAACMGFDPVIAGYVTARASGRLPIRTQVSP